MFDDIDYISIENKATKNPRTCLLILGRYLSLKLLKSTILHIHRGKVAEHR